MWLSPGLAWRRRRLRHQPVPCDGRPLTDAEVYELERARFALIDEDGTRRVAVDEEAAERFAAAKDGGEWQ
jgi:hypothetical protein